MESKVAQILVVDNRRSLLDEMVAEIEDQLEDRDEKTTIVKAQSVAEAISLIATNTFDAIVVDLRLGDEREADDSGLAVLRAAQKRDPSVPVIVVTNFGSVKLGASILRTGAFDFIDRNIPGINWLRLVGAKTRLAVEYHHSHP